MIGALSNLSDWSHGREFDIPRVEPRHEVINAGADRVDASNIGQHPFFDLAARSRSALRVWVGQELVVTGPFSQILTGVAARASNVHIRSLLMQVAFGEHNVMHGHVAERAHPWLLEKLRASIDLDPSGIEVLPETAEFLNVLESQCSGSLVRAVGALGMGNERLIIPEYLAIKDAFKVMWPECGYAEFLDSNIDEDETHWKVMADVASALVNAGASPREFLDGATLTLKARLSYYDALCARLMENSPVGLASAGA